MRTRINFDEVSVKAVKRWTDADGKKRQETKKFLQTLNPFNRGADGLPKSREQIMREITAEKNDWLAEVKGDE